MLKLLNEPIDVLSNDRRMTNEAILHRRSHDQAIWRRRCVESRRQALRDGFVNGILLRPRKLIHWSWLTAGTPLLWATEPG